MGDDEFVTEESEGEETDGETEEVEDGSPDVFSETYEIAPEHEERTRKERKEPRWMRDYENGESLFEKEELEANLASYISHDDPVSFDEAVKEKEWQEAMKLEIQAIERNQTWKLMSLPYQAKKIDVKWVYKKIK